MLEMGGSYFGVCPTQTAMDWLKENIKEELVKRASDASSKLSKMIMGNSDIIELDEPGEPQGPTTHVIEQPKAKKARIAKNTEPAGQAIEGPGADLAAMLAAARQKAGGKPQAPDPNVEDSQVPPEDVE